MSVGNDRHHPLHLLHGSVHVPLLPLLLLHLVVPLSQPCNRRAFSYLEVFVEEIAIAVAMVVVAILNWWADEH